MERMIVMAAQRVNRKRLLVMLAFAFSLWIFGFISTIHVPVLLKWISQYGEEMARMSSGKMKVVFKDRKYHIDRVCDMQSVKSHNKEFPPFPDMFYIFPKVNAAVCKIPKTGSVIMPKIMNILDAKLLNGRRKFDLTQYSVDDSKYNINIDILKGRGDKVQAAYVIIGRNPYDRILHHYVEEINVVSELNRQIGRTLRKPLKNVTVDGKTFDCGFQVDFHEYVDFLLENVLKSGLYNPVMCAPITRYCAPCDIKYDYVFKQETLPNDISYILNSTKMTPPRRKIIDQVLDHHHDEHLLFLDDYVTQVMASQRHHKQDCPEILALLYRIWESLKDQGILHVDSKFPHEVFGRVKNKPTIVTDAISIIRAEMKKNPVSSEQRTRQKQQQYKLFDGLNQIEIDKIKVAFKVDFFLFGYNSSPPAW